MSKCEISAVSHTILTKNIAFRTIKSMFHSDDVRECVTLRGSTFFMVTAVPSSFHNPPNFCIISRRHKNKNKIK